MLNNTKHFSLILFVIIFLTFSFCVYALGNKLVLVYPRDGAYISADSTFFVGNTHPKATLTINGQPAKVYANGSFVRVFNLHKGKNVIVLRSVLNNDIKIKKINLNVKASQKNSKTIIPAKLKKINTNFKIITKEAPLRKTPYGDRLTPVKKGVVFNAIGVLNKHYKVQLDEKRYAYIPEDSAKVANVQNLTIQNLNKISFNEDAKHVVIKIPVSCPVLTELFSENNILKVRLLNTKLMFEKICIKSPYIKSFNFSEDTFSVEFLANAFNGYDYYYSDNNFILKIKKPFNKGIRGKIIAIDAGHGGKEAGSIGPTEVPEKDINIKIATFLKEALEAKGATVVMTRNADNYVDLYERVQIAQDADADVLISIHNNALPDGKNPYLIHGTSTYYYQKDSLKLAQIIQKRLLKATAFKDHGIKYGSFVLTRPTMPVSVLVEVGFMINPFEYEQLLIPSNQKAYAHGLLKGLEEYFEL